MPPPFLVMNHGGVVVHIGAVMVGQEGNIVGGGNMGLGNAVIVDSRHIVVTEGLALVLHIDRLRPVHQILRETQLGHILHVLDTGGTGRNHLAGSHHVLFLVFQPQDTGVPCVIEELGFLTEVTGLAECAVIVLDEVTHDAIGAFPGAGNVDVAAIPHGNGHIRTNDIIEQVDVVAIRLHEDGEVATAQTDDTFRLALDIDAIGIESLGETDLFRRQNPAAGFLQ